MFHSYVIFWILYICDYNLTITINLVSMVNIIQVCFLLPYEIAPLFTKNVYLIIGLCLSKSPT